VAVYDDEREKIGTDLPSDDDLRRMTGINEEQEGAHEREATSGAADDILQREHDAAEGGSSDHQAEADEKSSLLKGGDDGGSGGFSFHKEGLKGLANLKSKAKKAKNKKMILGAVSGGGLLLVVLVVIMLIIGSQIIPNFAQNMIAYSFARSARETMDSSAEVEAEKIALDTAPDQAFQNAENTFAKEADTTTGMNLWDKINQYRPEKVIDNMRASGQMYFDYQPDNSLNPIAKLAGRKTIQKIYIGGNEIDIPKNSYSTLDKILNPIDYTKGLWNSNKAILTSLSDEMTTTLRGTNYIRALAAFRKINATLDIKLYRWDKEELNKLESDTVETADIENARESVKIETDNFQAATEAESGLQSGSQEANAAQQSETDIENCVASDKCLLSTIQSGGGLPSSTIGILNKIFASSILDSILKFVGPTYAIAAPLCMIYEGSMVNSGGIINANSGELQRSAYQVMSAADQQKYGNVNGNAIGSQERQMGNNGEIANSNVIKRAEGIPVDTTQAGVDPQSSGSGSYTYDIFSFLGPTVDGLLRPVINPVCAIFNNAWSGAIIGIALLIIPGVGEAMRGAEEGVTIGVSQLISRIVVNIGRTIAQMFTKQELAKMLVIGGATIAGSLLAKYITLQHMGAIYNGMSRNQSFDNNAEAGAILNSQDIDRQQNMAAPMTASGTAQAKVLDLSYVTHQQQSQSVFQRYFAVDNADSFISRLGMMAWAHASLSAIPSLVLSAGRIFNPVSAFSSIFNLMQNKSLAAASSTTDTADYNIIQWGWTPIEEWHYEHDPGYSMLHNQQVLNQSGQEQSINSTYMTCFTSKIGDLLSGGELQRDGQANIITNTGTCAPDNLSPLNRDDPNVTDPLTFANPTAALVFRWRVAIRNQNALNQLIDTSSPSTSSSTTTPTSGGCGGGKYGALVGSGSSFAGVDQGIDFVPSGKGAYNICAPASGTITLADQTGHHFMRTTGQAEIIEKLDQAPGAPSSSQFIYYAEIITLSSSTRVGAHVNKGDVIGTNGQSPGIEVGWGLDATNGFMCAIGYPTACGTSFNNWVQQQ
jgi:Sec-independent protein translocase protein TatA